MKKSTYFIIGGVILAMFVGYKIAVKLEEKRAEKYASDLYNTGGIK
jgi:hypothetical protein